MLQLKCGDGRFLSKNKEYVVSMCHQPCERQLAGCTTVSTCNAVEHLHDGEILGKIFFRESGLECSRIFRSGEYS